MLEFTEYTKIFISLFAILDPIGMIPVIIMFTVGMSASQRNRTGRLASLTVLLILLIALFIGEPVLSFFGISINAFRLAGGLLLMIMALKMLNGTLNEMPPADESITIEESRSMLAIVPLSTPLLAGPGSISTVILDAHKAASLMHYLSMSLIILILGFSVWLTFLIAPWVENRMGRTGIDIFTRLMGLILASIAVEFIAGGLRGLFPVLG
ncbi:MAG: NAAT family transporter [Gallionellaceae bacterium]|jgi:multiple antibiotic resistance protein